VSFLGAGIKKRPLGETPYELESARLTETLPAGTIDEEITPAKEELGGTPA